MTTSDDWSSTWVSGTNQPTPSATVHAEVRLNAAGTSTPHWATIAGSPHAPPRAAAGWVLRRSWPARVSGSELVRRWQRAWSAAVNRRVGMLTGSLPQPDRSTATRPSTPIRGRTDPRKRARDPDTAELGQTRSDVDGRAGERSGDALEVLHLRDDQLPELVDVAGLGAHDHVVRAGDVLRKGHALDLGDLARHLGGLAHVGLDEDVRLDDHGLSPPRRWSGGLGVVRATTYRAVR